MVLVALNGQQESLPLVIVSGAGPSLLGRIWLSRLQLDWKAIHKVQAHTLDGSIGSISPGVC